VLARAGLAAVVLCLVATASPAVAGRLVAPDGFEAIPGYWRQAADWLADARPSGRALLVPASSFGTYVWGSTADEPLQPLASTPWEVRNAVPLTPAGHIRMLDAIEDRLARGEGSAGLTRALARAGISHLVVRNDLSADAGAARPALVQQALRTSPGLRRVATFGPVYPAAEHLLDRFLDAGLTPRRPAVEIYAVADPAPRAYTTPLAAVATVLGGPDGVLALEEHGLLDGRPAFLPEEPGATGGRTTLVSDAQLRRERAFGRIDAAGSAALTADDPLRLDDPARDYLYPGAELGESVVSFDGATISASSSASDADSFGGAVPAAAPFAALDGDPATAWRPAQRLAAEEAWWRVESAHVLSARSITVRLADDAQSRPPALLRITTEAGSLTVAPADTAAPQTFPLPPGATHLLTIATVPPAPGDPPGAFGLAEVGLPGLDFDRTVVTPASDAGVAGFAFDAATPAAAGCVVDRDGRPRCAEALVRAAEESRGIAREFTVGRAAEYGLTVTALPRAGADLDALIATTARPWGPAVEVSSTVAPDPRAGADALVDGDPRTVWRAAAGDNHPAITLSWAAPRTFDRLRLVTPEDAAGSVPQVIALESDGGRRQTLRLAADGTAQFPPITTARLILTFPVLGEASSFDPYRHTVSPLGVAVGELEIADVPRADPSQIVTLDCGHGPTVELDGRLHRTAVRTTLAGLRALAPVEVTPCDGDPAGLLAAGTHRIVVRGTAAFTVTAATLRRAGAEAGEASRTAARVVAWDREHRVLALPARDEPLLLVVPENANPGWAATLDGAPLTARTVDGWQQGYLVPAGPAGEVHLDFGPGGTYRAALLAGAAAVVLLLAVLLLPVRRPGPPAPRRRQRTGLLVALAFAAGLALVGGVAGLAVLAGVAAFGLLHRGRRLVVLGRLALGALLLGGASLVLLPAGFAEPAGQLLALVALSALVAAVLPGRGSLERSATRGRHRLSGRSTIR
jgi:arabinofuranan 3-O-arabinosyltransferase